MSYVGFGIPWVALGMDRLFGDSGFLCIYEPLVEIFRQTGNKSLIYLDRRHKEKFESVNNPQATGVYPVYSSATRNPSRALDQPIDDTAANKILDGVCPVDYIITNKNFVLPHLVGQSLSFKGPGLPIVYVCLNAGKDAVTKPVSKAQDTLHNVQINDQDTYSLYMEAMTYMASSYIVWSTEDQRRRGMDIAKRFLAPVEIARLKKRSMINGCGITDLVKPYQKSDADVRAALQTPKDNFSVTFLGRVTGNKNVGYILDTMQPLFVKHNIRLDMKTSKMLPPAKRFAENDDPSDGMVSSEMFSGGFASREEYASRLLPSIQCMMYASIAEGYCITPREAVYIGVPVLVPRRPWAETAFGPEYPFYYSSQPEAFALIKRIEEGRVTDGEVRQFLATRANGFTCEFLSDVSAKLFRVCRDLVNTRRDGYRHLAHSRVLEIFESVTKPGEVFTFQDLFERFSKSGMVIGGGHSKRATNSTEMYPFLCERLDCVDPVAGKFKRIE
jgi:hypothetical protein